MKAHSIPLRHRLRLPQRHHLPLLTEALLSVERQDLVRTLLVQPDFQLGALCPCQLSGVFLGCRLALQSRQSDRLILLRPLPDRARIAPDGILDLGRGRSCPGQPNSLQTLEHPPIANLGFGLAQLGNFIGGQLKWSFCHLLSLHQALLF